uniref:Malic enzyme N-terminal domain-containing protein n=1 Tax=Leersia perrieri TaxID=77586 RepID=A0A0D9VUY4_9ORYZ
MLGGVRWLQMQNTADLYLRSQVQELFLNNRRSATSTTSVASSLLPSSRRMMGYKKLMHDLCQYNLPLQRYISMMELQASNERLFYDLLIDNVEELLLVVYTPTVGEGCQKYGSIYRHPQGIYITLKECHPITLNTSNDDEESENNTDDEVFSDYNANEGDTDKESKNNTADEVSLDYNENEGDTDEETERNTSPQPPVDTAEKCAAAAAGHRWLELLRGSAGVGRCCGWRRRWRLPARLPRRGHPRKRKHPRRRKMLKLLVHHLELLAAESPLQTPPCAAANRSRRSPQQLTPPVPCTAAGRSGRRRRRRRFLAAAHVASVLLAGDS